MCVYIPTHNLLSPRNHGNTLHWDLLLRQLGHFLNNWLSPSIGIKGAYFHFSQLVSMLLVGSWFGKKAHSKVELASWNSCSLVLPNLFFVFMYFPTFLPVPELHLIKRDTFISLVRFHIICCKCFTSLYCSPLGPSIHNVVKRVIIMEI